MKYLLEKMEPIPQGLAFATAIFLIFLLGILDYLTGFEVSFSIFYLIPVAFVSWLALRPYAVAVSLLSAASWYLADITAGHQYSHPAIPVWNAAMRLGFFLIVALSIREIRKLLLQERRLSRVDNLTGIYNSRAFRELAQVEIEKAERFGRPLTIAYIDVDNFKQVNDTQGHSAGDMLLQSVGRTLRENTRSSDIISRLGGDEFSLLMPETDRLQAEAAMTKLQGRLLDTAERNSWPVTFSIGVVTCAGACRLDEMIQKADNIMYEAKEGGKNRVVYGTYAAAAPPEEA